MRLVEENFGATQSKASNLAGREPEVGQAHFTGTWAHRAGLALLAQPRASASRREYYYLPHRSLATPARGLPARFLASTCLTLSRAFRRWRPWTSRYCTRVARQPSWQGGANYLRSNKRQSMIGAWCGADFPRQR